METEPNVDIQQGNIEALGHAFFLWGWNQKIPEVISKWGDFSCDSHGFKLEISIPDGGTLRVQLFERDPSRARELGVCFQYKRGANCFQVEAEPVDTIELVRIGRKRTPALCFWAGDQRVVVTRGGRWKVNY